MGTKEILSPPTDQLPSEEHSRRNGIPLRWRFLAACYLALIGLRVNHEIEKAYKVDVAGVVEDYAGQVVSGARDTLGEMVRHVGEQINQIQGLKTSPK